MISVNDGGDRWQQANPLSQYQAAARLLHLQMLQPQQAIGVRTAYQQRITIGQILELQCLDATQPPVSANIHGQKRLP